MDVTRDLLCWGYSKFFEIIRFERPVSAEELSIAAFDDRRRLPVELYPLTIDLADFPIAKAAQGPVLAFDGALERAVASHLVEPLAFQPAISLPDVDAAATWLIVGPFLYTSPVRVVVRRAEETVIFRSEPWEIRICSDANFIRYPELCRRIIEYDRASCYGRLHPRLLQQFEAERGVIWRLDVCWHEPSAAERPDNAPIGALTFHLEDENGAPIECTPYFFEDQPGASFGDRPHRRIYSLAIPTSAYCFTATVEGPDSGLASGFFALNGLENHRTKGFTDYCLANAADDRFFYECWFERHRADALDCERQAQRCRSAKAPDDPLFSVIIVGSADDDDCVSTIRSVVAQSLPFWELLHATPALARAGATPGAAVGDARVRRVVKTLGPSQAEKLNEALRHARGRWIVFANAGDRWEPDALYRFAEAIAKHPEAAVFTCDEDALDAKGHVQKPVFKTRLNVDLLYASDDIGSPLAIRRDQLDRLRPLTSTAAGAELYDLALRALGAGAEFHHVPRVLSHRPLEQAEHVAARAATAQASRQALRRHLADRGIAARVDAIGKTGRWRVRYELPEPKPRISVVIPNKDHGDVLRECVDSLLSRLAYDDFDITIVENNSTDPETFRLYDELLARDGRVNVVRYEGPFNYSAIINFGVRHTTGELLLLLNNDTKLIAPDSLTSMAGFFQRPEVGVVGAKLYFRDHLVQHVGMLVGTYGAVCHVNQNFTRDRGGYRNLAICPANFSSVTGACQMTSRRIFDELGGYEEALAVGFNDVDYCLKVQKAGFRVVMDPFAEFYHYEFTTRLREEGDAEQMARWESEKALMHERWPEIFDEGDPYLNPNLDRNNFYYNLPRP